MVEQGWNGGRGDTQLYRQDRAGKQKEVAAHHERIRSFLEKRGPLWAVTEFFWFGKGKIRAEAQILAGNSLMTTPIDEA